MKKYNCSWFEPTYEPMVNIESEDSILDENRGFDENERAFINEMKVGEVVCFEDLIIVRLNDEIEDLIIVRLNDEI